MKVFVRTDIGKVRAINEDSFYLPGEGECFCAVADGMGGHNAGEVASAMAVDVFCESMRAANVNAHCMRAAVEQANAQVFEKSLQNNQCSGMGTTFTALGWAGRDVHIAHVGDSRAYLLRNGSLMRLTVDHTLVEEMVIKGLITPREAKYHPKRHFITRALGTAPQVEVDMIRVEMQPGDAFFLCSDGLSNHVEEKTIREITLGEGGWQEKLEKMVGVALDNGGNDNITAMYAICGEDHK